MKVKDRVVVVTGGAHGIGRALCERFHKEGAKTIVVVDVDGAKAHDVAESVGGVAFTADVSLEQDIRRVIAETQVKAGPIDLFCSNAGVGFTDGPHWTATSCANENWQKSWDINVMAHIYAVRALLPSMINREDGYFLITASAAGLLSQIGDAAYSTTKHAAIGFAESLAITHRDDGIRVSVLCPQYVDTRLIKKMKRIAESVDEIISPEDVAESVIEGLDQETFLILPHPQVGTYMAHKTANYDRWLDAMRKLRRTWIGDGVTPL